MASFSRCQLTRGKCDCSAKDGMRRALSLGKGGRMPIRVGRERQREQSLPVAQIGKSLGESGESVGVRTRDLLIKSQLLYRLSYALPRWTGQRFAAPAGSARNICRRPIAVNRKIMPFTGVRHISCQERKKVIGNRVAAALENGLIAAGEDACRLPIFPCGAP